MALNFPALEALMKLSKLVGGGRVACLGYPDALLTQEQIRQVCDPDSLPYRQDSAQIINWHRLAGRLDRIPETWAVLQRIGLDGVFIDIHSSRDVELELDLNEPIPEWTYNKYDIVFDAGTMEHCFNIGQVAKNILAMCRVGGGILHASPVNIFNHGFYNLNPTWFHDWYRQNGHHLLSDDCMGITGALDAPQAFLASYTKTLMDLPGRSSLLVSVQKVHDMPMKWPMQTKYIETPNLKRSAA